jgi:hypothetical protein
MGTNDRLDPFEVKIIDNVNETLGDDLKIEVTGAQGPHRCVDLLDLRLRGAPQGAGAGRRAGVHLHCSVVRPGRQRTGSARSGESSSSRRDQAWGVEPLRLGVRDQAAQQAHPARHRPGVRGVDPPQGHVPLERHRQPDAAVRRRRRPGRLHAAAGLHDGRSRLRARQRRLQHGAEDRCSDGVAVPGAVRPDLAQPQPRSRTSPRWSTTTSRACMPRTPRADLLPDPLQPVQRVPRGHQRGRAAERPHRLPGDEGLAEPLQLPARRRRRHHQQAGDLQRLHPRRQRRPREDVHGAGRHQVLRAAQQGRPGAHARRSSPRTGPTTTRT